MVDGMARPSELGVELIHGFGEEAMTLAVGRASRDLLESKWDDPGWQIAERLGTLWHPGQAQERHPRHHPVAGVQGVRDRLGAVRGDPTDDLGIGGEDPLEQLAA